MFCDSRCLLMHTGALYLTSGHQQLSRTCSMLHTYHTVVFLVTFLLTLLSITVSSLNETKLYYETC